MRHTKIVVPPPPSQSVERPGVRALLDEQGRPTDLGRVLLVSAPVGYGKTVAVADWVRSSTGVPTAWVSLDAVDRDLDAWWTSVLGALRSCPGGPGEAFLRDALPPDRAGAAAEAFTASVLEALDHLPAPVRLVLDDVHEIVGHPAEHALHALVRYPLPNLTVVLCSRFDAPFGVDRLRLEGRLGELRADQLAFGDVEAGRLFEATGIELTADQVATLVGRTEGWVAALRLVALSLETATDRGSVVDAFAGDDRSVTDYLTDEVLGALGEAERRALEAGSACSPIAVELAVVLTGDPGAGAVLEQLGATTGMVTPTDRHRGHYRVHELLCSHLLARMRRSRPERLRETYQQAARWHEAENDPPAAMHFAALAGDVVGTEALLREDAVDLLARGRFAALREPGRLVEARGVDPGARLTLALAALEEGDVGHADSLFEDAGPVEELGELGVLRRIVGVRLALAHDDPRRGRAIARTIDPEGMHVPALRALARTTRGLALADADGEVARHEGERALEIARERGWHHLVLQARTVLALAAVHRHRLREATEHAEVAIELSPRFGGDATPWAAGALLVRAVAHLLGGRPGPALDDVARVEGTGLHADALAVVRGAAEFDVGRPAPGGQRLRGARMGRAPVGEQDGEVGVDDGAALVVAALIEQDVALGTGRMREATEVTRVVGDRLGGTGDLAVLRARDAWAADRDEEARRFLTPVLDGAHPCIVTALATIQAGVLDAEIALRHRQMPLARRRLLDALEVAGREDLLRPLLRASPAVHQYLAARQGMFGADEGRVRRVLAGVGARPATAAVALTEREREVLQLLPTTRSAAEIAEDLAVSTNTVKTHQRAIYHKLGAGGRRDAVSRARQAGLLTHSA